MTALSKCNKNPIHRPQKEAEAKQNASNERWNSAVPKAKKEARCPVIDISEWPPSEEEEVEKSFSERREFDSVKKNEPSQDPLLVGGRA